MNNLISKIQTALKAENVDGWLLCGFQNQNPLVSELFSLGHSTRKFFIFIPTRGKAKVVSSHIDRNLFEALPFDGEEFSKREGMLSKLKRVLPKRGRIVIEISENCNLPNISLVDNGTVQLIRGLIPEIKLESSGNVIQSVLSAWTPSMHRSHIKAACMLHKIQKDAFSLISTRIRNGKVITEKDVQVFIRGQFEKNGIVTDHLPVVASGKNTSNPHFATEDAPIKSIQRGEVVLIDLWGKLTDEDAVFADITWMGFTGENLPLEVNKAWETVIRARDKVVEVVIKSWREKKVLRGFEVDDIARSAIREAGLADSFIHRTGHSIDRSLHGRGVNLDNFETHDDRKLVPGAGFSVEPGVYLAKFGIRSEINMFIDPIRGPVVTTQVQRDVILL